MKVTFEFDTEKETFSNSELEAHYQCDKMVSALNDIVEKARDWYKWDQRTSIPDDEIQTTILQIINDYGIDLDRL